MPRSGPDGKLEERHTASEHRAAAEAAPRSGPDVDELRSKHPRRRSSRSAGRAMRPRPAACAKAVAARPVTRTLADKDICATSRRPDAVSRRPVGLTGHCAGREERYMPDSKSCDCFEQLAEARARRQAAEDAWRRAVTEFHRAVVKAIDGPACSHSQRAVAKAAGLSLGGVHNALVSIGSPDAVALPPITGAPASIPEARREAMAEPIKSAPASIPEARREVAPERPSDPPPDIGAPELAPEARRDAPPPPRSATKSPSGTTVRRVNRYASREGPPVDRRNASTNPVRSTAEPPNKRVRPPAGAGRAAGSGGRSAPRPEPIREPKRPAEGDDRAAGGRGQDDWKVYQGIY
jgi:hypothetical protein